MSVEAVVVARRLLGERVVSAHVTARTPMAYDPYLSGRSAARVTGVAELPDGVRTSWAAVAKVTTGTGIRSARRELAAYREGIAPVRARSGLGAPALLGWTDEDGRVELWIEEVQDVFGGAWPVERFAVAARHIGAWDATRHPPLAPGFDAEDAWAERHGQPGRIGEAVAELLEMAGKPGSQEVAGALGDPSFGRTRALVLSTPARIRRLAAFPVVLLHHDLVRSNLFAVDEASTVAIDWENVGHGPLGVDLAPLVIGSVRRGEASADDLPALEQAVLGGYLEALRGEGIEAAHAVHGAYRLALGLRWHVVLGTIRSLVDPTSSGFRGSRREESRDEALRHLVGVSRHILDQGSMA